MSGQQRVVVASSNPGKLAEIRRLLAPLNFGVVAQAELGIGDAEEPAPTFVENAILKARHAAAHCEGPVLADDSGLEVPALGGAPGIFSARYAGTHGDNAANNRKLLNEMSALSGRDREASFRCVMVWLRHANDPVPIIAEGVWRGVITDAPRGDGGFGYDPLFLVPALQQTGAELEAEHKNRISHRGQALAELVLKLKSLK